MESLEVAYRRGQRVIRMVWELHKLGYQRLRIMPYFTWKWRLAIGPVDLFINVNGAFAPDANAFMATYAFGSGNKYFGWEDAKSDTAHALALKFVERFPEIAEKGRGRDWAYAGWLSELLGRIESTGELPFVMEEDYSIPPERLRFIPLSSPERFTDSGKFDLPPPGPRLWPEASRALRSVDPATVPD